MHRWDDVNKAVVDTLKPAKEPAQKSRSVAGGMEKRGTLSSQRYSLMCLRT
jgi:hypothetical protein